MDRFCCAGGSSSRALRYKRSQVCAEPTNSAPAPGAARTRRPRPPPAPAAASRDARRPIPPPSISERAPTCCWVEGVATHRAIKVINTIIIQYHKIQYATKSTGAGEHLELAARCRSHLFPDRADLLSPQRRAPSPRKLSDTETQPRCGSPRSSRSSSWPSSPWRPSRTPRRVRRRPKAARFRRARRPPPHHRQPYSAAAATARPPPPLGPRRVGFGAGAHGAPAPLISSIFLRRCGRHQEPFLREDGQGDCPPHPQLALGAPPASRPARPPLTHPLPPPFPQLWMLADLPHRHQGPGRVAVLLQEGLL